MYYEGFNDPKYEDVITGHEKVQIGKMSKYVEVPKYFTVNGEKFFECYRNVKKTFYYLYFKTANNIEYRFDDELAELLNMDVDKYKKLVHKFGKFFQEEDCVLFPSVGLANKAIEVLEPYLVLNALLPGNEKRNIDKLPDFNISDFEDENNEDEILRKHFKI